MKNWAIATPGNKVWHSPDLVKFDYNPAEAKKLLAGMGWKDSNGDGIIEDARGNPVTFSLKTNSSNTTRIAMMNFIKSDLAKVGINVITAPVDFNTLITNLRSDFQYDAMLLGLQSGVPPDPTMMQNVWRSTGLTHSWFLAQAKPDTPQEARIDQLMDVILGDARHRRAQEGIQGSRNDRQRDGVDDMAARTRPEDPGQQPLRQPPAQHPPPPDSMELGQPLRQMTRALPVSIRLFVIALLAVVAVTGCRRRAAEVAEYTDPHPLPEDPWVVDAPSLGKHGGRFVFAETGNPRTFNAHDGE